jgi:uncharacterized membrane protein
VFYIHYYFFWWVIRRELFKVYAFHVQIVMQWFNKQRSGARVFVKLAVSNQSHEAREVLRCTMRRLYCQTTESKYACHLLVTVEKLEVVKLSAAVFQQGCVNGFCYFLRTVRTLKAKYDFIFE